MPFITTSHGIEIYDTDQGDGTGFLTSQTTSTLTLWGRGAVCGTRRSTP
jgi:hypothetical protein